MNIFKKKVGSTDNEISKSSNVNWNQITTLSQLNEIQEISKTKPAIIFKHSTTCMISRMALKNFEKEFELQNEVEAYLLDLLNFREISNQIAAKFDVKHQSPQLLLIKNEIAVYNTSHESIDAATLKSKI